MADWTFLTNHGLVMAVIATHSRSTAREIGDAVGITERATHKIIRDLEEGGYITRSRDGRQNEYTIHPNVPLKDAVTDAAVGELLTVLAGKRRRRRAMQPTGENGSPERLDLASDAKAG